MLNELIKRFPALEPCRDDIKNAAESIIECYKNGGKVLLCGNGGSCADSEHIVGELMKGFIKRRPLSEKTKKEMTEKEPLLDEKFLAKLQGGLPAISLTSFSALNTAFANDVDPDMMYAQALYALGKSGDVLIALSTSGNAENVFCAVKVARALGIKVIGMSGSNGGKLREYSDICIRVPEDETFKVQELHLPVYHYLCAEVEEYFF